MADGRASELGSSLMLAPAGVLILIVLASISADSALAYLARRQLDSVVAAAANDVATQAIPDGSGATTLQAGSAARPDPVLAQRIADDIVMQSFSGGLVADDVQTDVDDATVTVTATGHVDYIFAKAIPGVRHQAVVRAQAHAEVRFR